MVSRFPDSDYSLDQITDLGHQELEDLVQASVFNPSPCKRLRERVLRDAVRAQHQQKIGKRVWAAAGAFTVVALVGFLVVRGLTASSPAPEMAAPPPDNVSVATDPTPPSPERTAPSPFVPTAAHPSYGEALYRGDVVNVPPANGLDAARKEYRN